MRETRSDLRRKATATEICWKFGALRLFAWIQPCVDKLFHGEKRDEKKIHLTNRIRLHVTLKAEFLFVKKNRRLKASTFKA